MDRKQLRSAALALRGGGSDEAIEALSDATLLEVLWLRAGKAGEARRKPRSGRAGGCPGEDAAPRS